MGIDVSGAKSPKSEPNVVPLCDVLLVLLIIFMVITPLVQAGADVKLPDAKNTANQPEPGSILTFYVSKAPKDSKDKTPWVFMESERVKKNKTEDITSQDDFGEILAQRIPEMIKAKLEDDPNAAEKRKKVLLKADGELPYGVLADVMRALRSAQIEFIGLITEKKLTSIQ